MSCQICGGQAINPEWNYCPECGANLKGECGSCRFINKPGANFCVKCGGSLRQGLMPVVLKLNDSVSLVIDNLNVNKAGITHEHAAPNYQINADPENTELPAENSSASKLSVANYKNVELTLSKKDKGSRPPVDYSKIAEEVIGSENAVIAVQGAQPEETLGLNTFNESETPDFLRDLIAKNKKKKTAAAEPVNSLNETSGNENASGSLTSLSSITHKSVSLPPIKPKAEAKNINFEKEIKINNIEKKPIIEDIAAANTEISVFSEPAVKNNDAINSGIEKKAEIAMPVKEAISAIEPAVTAETETITEKTTPDFKNNSQQANEKNINKPKLENILKKEPFAVTEKAAARDKTEDKNTEIAKENKTLTQDELKPAENENAAGIPAKSVEIKEAAVHSEKPDANVQRLKTYRLIATDSGNNRIQFIDSEGKFISSFGLRGAGKAQFDNPQKAVIDSHGNIFVSDFSNNRIQKFSKDGQFLTSFGTYGTKGGEFNYPAGMAISKEGLLFVVDSYNNRIQIFDLDGEFVSKYEGIEGSSSNEFDTPSSIAIDNENCIYVCDTGNNRIIKFDSKWKKIFELGQFNKKNAGFDNPSGISIGYNNNLIVADTGNHLIKVFEPGGSMTFCFGAKGFKEGKFDSPGSAVIDSDNNFYVADTWNNRIQIFSGDGRFIKIIGAYGADPGKFNHINDIIICDENK